MNIAIIGAGPRAAGIASLLTGGGYDVVLADGFHGPSPYEVITGRDIVIFATPRSQVPDLVVKVGRLLPEVIIVDATEGDPHPQGESGAELLAHYLDSHRVIRASIQVPEPNANILLAGDDRDAMTEVEKIFRKSGCVTTDRGPLARAAEIEPPTVAGVTV